MPPFLVQINYTIAIKKNKNLYLLRFLKVVESTTFKVYFLQLTRTA